MNWSGNMPMKMIQARKRSDPNIKLYKALDDANEANPLDISHIKTSFPYFPKARQFSQAIYKVNLPGYFYHLVDSSTGYIDSGVVMSYKASNIDVYALGVWMYGYSWTGCAACSGGGFVYLADRVVSNWTGSYSVPASPRKAYVTSNHDRINLFVTTGFASNRSNYGGYANQFFPVIPGDCGVGTPNSMTGLHIIITRKTYDDNGKETGSTDVELELNGKRISGYKKETDVTQSGDTAASGTPTTDESIGTFVYWRSSKNSFETYASDGKWFAPCECVADKDCNCISKVRSVSKNFGYNMIEVNPITELYGSSALSASKTYLGIKEKSDGSFEMTKDKDGKEVYVTESKTVIFKSIFDIGMYLLYNDQGTYDLDDGATLDPKLVNTWHSLFAPSIDSGYLTKSSEPALTRATTVFDKCFEGASIEGFTSPFTKLVYPDLPEIQAGFISYSIQLYGAVTNTDTGETAYMGAKKNKKIVADSAPQDVPSCFWYNVTQTTVNPASE